MLEDPMTGETIRLYLVDGIATGGNESIGRSWSRVRTLAGWYELRHHGDLAAWRPPHRRFRCVMVMAFQDALGQVTMLRGIRC